MWIYIWTLQRYRTFPHALHRTTLNPKLLISCTNIFQAVCFGNGSLRSSSSHRCPSLIHPVLQPRKGTLRSQQGGDTFKEVANFSSPSDTSCGKMVSSSSDEVLPITMLVALFQKAGPESLARSYGHGTHKRRLNIVTSGSWTSQPPLLHLFSSTQLDPDDQQPCSKHGPKSPHRTSSGLNFVYRSLRWGPGAKKVRLGNIFVEDRLRWVCGHFVCKRQCVSRFRVW